MKRDMIAKSRGNIEERHPEISWSVICANFREVYFGDFRDLAAI